ncbi:hypothetical protein K443DRAFT_10127 [Laccaria amethystina LaAM-08-1]|uniref:Uncharacterized protein n=1 Tax=Laccaria amethystina LaAM-08-1 TaxID=1095629 RepID=A0A0C9WLC9_9AGAR|nr:hypothetical protein K443DRAFT_10127 [Laccaria amethystina LaAM-08-1]
MNPTRDRNLVVRSRQKLVRHSKIRSLNLSNDGSFLLSAAGDEVIVWDLKDGMHLVINASNGLVLALAWVPITSDASAAFAFGCSDGLIHLFRRAGKKRFFVPSASVHLEDGAVEHLVYNSNLGCLAGVAVRHGRAHLWRVDEEGHLTSVTLPDEEPTFPDGIPKQAYRYSNGNHIYIKLSNNLGVINVIRWAPPVPGLIKLLFNICWAVFDPIPSGNKVVFFMAMLILPWLYIHYTAPALFGSID